MFPLWDVAIAPILHAAGARRVVEIGALRGETTIKMLDDLGPDAELHVIDPVPDFDPREHERAFPGRYVFHEALSLEVLPTLPPMDAALIDGDHNWYTVYHELRLLSEGARRAGAPMPVMVMHDVGWPYGRRDLYYAPEQIPEEFRQPYAQRGMRPGGKKLIERGGLNPTMCNALEEGGPRNGVMTGLDDFVAEYDRPLRVVVLPIYFGLAIVVEESRLSEQPELAAALDHLESAEGRGRLLEVAEQVRLRAMMFQHNVYFQENQQLARARRRYLEVVKSALLNEHYLDHEVRFELLVEHITKARPLVPNQLRDPVRNEQTAYRRIARNRFGPGGPDAGAATNFLPYTPMGRAQLDHLEHCLDTVCAAQVPGDLVEYGTGRGGGAIFMRAYLDAHEIAERNVLVADRFRAAEPPATAPTLPAQGIAGLRADLNLVRDGFERFGVLDDRVAFLQGPADATLRDVADRSIALLRIGRGTGTDARAVLEALYDQVPDGGYVVVDDRPDSQCRQQVDAFRRERGISTPLEPVDAAAVAWRRSHADEATTTATPTAADLRPAHPPLAPPSPPEPVDLSVVAVFYNMRREAARTLHSLSRAYQEGLEDVTYEVIVVENGSDPDQRLSPEFVSSFGPEFRLLDVGPGAEPSPVRALNQGIRAGRGRAFALMIDGAHVLTPGVLHFGLAGLRTYAPAIVATQQWYVGPGQQGDAMDDGYDQEYEDRLFESIRWPSAGHRLFEIGNFVGDRDWLDGLWESNCMFVPRAQLEQVGCFDESFDMPGGGYANLELYERLGSSPDVTVCTILGEGSFHQVHGGTTTNQTDAALRRDRVFGYSRHYGELRGRPFKGPGKPIHFVGRVPNQAARRSKPRRMSAAAFTESARAGNDGVPTSPTPVPQELEAGFTEAVWRSLPWTNTTWLGRRITSAPTDLLAYQEIIAEVRPDWIVEIGAGDGGRSLFLASICELVGHGEVLAIDTEVATESPQHPRLRYLAGIALEQAVRDEVDRIVGSGRALVVLGACTDRVSTVGQFRSYASLVPVGSYVVVTDTIVNGNPVWPAFGPGPLEALKQVLNTDGRFMTDPLMEKYSLTFNPGGFLRRVS
ncbi:MAG: class I SAM-dependent methyltransferase [Acidimicrobiia bacterium]|nr:class I SAM-dependent methyltransferase [Acidimicrobiia bacterium]